MEVAFRKETTMVKRDPRVTANHTELTVPRERDPRIGSNHSELRPEPGVGLNHTELLVR
jgi:hypothetical protein